MPSQCDLISLRLGNMMLTECLSVTFGDRVASFIGWGAAVEYGTRGDIIIYAVSVLGTFL